MTTDWFGICANCGAAISRQPDGVTPAMDTWVDTALWDVCGDGMHEPILPPVAGTPVVFVKTVGDVEEGTHGFFVMLPPDDTTRWYVAVPPAHGLLGKSVLVTPDCVQLPG